MRKYLVLVALAFGLVAPAAARADGCDGCNGCKGCKKFGWKGPDQYGFAKKGAPRAAPWFLYWPYDAYFTMPAPTGVAFPPGYMSAGGFNPNMYQGANFAPYPTNGFGQTVP
jgi:hypothetical protein